MAQISFSNPSAILSSMSWLALPYFPILSHKWNDLLKTFIENKLCFFYYFYNFCLRIFLITRRIQGDINVHRCSRNVPVILVRFYWKLDLLNRFSSNIKYHENPSRGIRVVLCGQMDGQSPFAILRTRIKIAYKKALYLSLPVMVCTWEYTVNRFGKLRKNQTTCYIKFTMGK